MQKGNLDFEWQSRDNDEEEEDEEYITMIYILRRRKKIKRNLPGAPKRPDSRPISEDATISLMSKKAHSSTIGIA